MSALEFAIECNPNPLPDAEREEILANPGFGKYSTDHMIRIDWTADKGRRDAELQAYGLTETQPSSPVLHYGQSILEGPKAYRMPDGSVVTFRPEQNARRFQRSANRIAMPRLLEETLLEAIRPLVEIDTAWVSPAGGEESLYLCPIMFSIESTLGMRPSNSYTFLLIVPPAGAYFPGGINLVTVWISHEYVRAAPGGAGVARFVGNYAAPLAVQQRAEEKGRDQVVWLDAAERKYIEEMGGMNLAPIYSDEIVDASVRLAIPELFGSLLSSITWASLLQVVRDLGINVEECCISAEEWKNDATSGVMGEAFVYGTVVVITPVGFVKSAEGGLEVNSGNASKQTMKLREHLTGIQYGKVEDTHGWIYKLVEV